MKKIFLKKTKFFDLKTFFFLIFFALLETASYAADPDHNIIREQDWISRNQQNILEEKKRNTEFETIKKERERKKKKRQLKNLHH